MTATIEECNARGRSQTQWERGPDLYPVPNVPNEVGPTLLPHYFNDCLAQLWIRLRDLFVVQPCLISKRLTQRD